MSFLSLRKSLNEQFHLLVELGRWIPVACYAGVMAGTASAILLASLTLATNLREAHIWLILLLAPAGWAVGLMYKLLGKSVEGGNNLILEQVHNPQEVIPLRMTPLILIGTFVSHLFGGSAGREGTAIQTGASLADQLSRPLHLSPADRRILLMAGISAGFASVFGTPMAGAVFGIEVLAIGTLSYDAIAPCFLAAFIGDLVTREWAKYLPGAQHTIYRVAEVPSLSVLTILYAGIAGVAFGLTGMAFARVTHAVAHLTRRLTTRSELRPVLGGLVVTIAVFAIGYTRTHRYIGLGIPTIVAAFHTRLPSYDFLAKFLFTAVTLGSGFKGGEVTPLFFIGATLGNALSRVLPLPASLLAGMGFVGVFAGAANTPIASTFMAFELFGPEAGAFAGIACVVSYLVSGHAGIYTSQRVGRSKHLAMAADEGLSLALLSKLREQPEDDLLDRLAEHGHPNGKFEGLSVLRLYFSALEMHRAGAWWKRIAPQALGVFLLEQAKEQGLDQALLHRVTAGYIQSQDLAAPGRELPVSQQPQCLELFGEEADLRSFLRHNSQHLRNVRVVFLKGRVAQIESQIGGDELEESLQLEQNAPLDTP